MADTRTADQIKDEIARFRVLQHETTDANLRRHLEAMVQERHRDLRAMDDTPIIPHRASVPPSAPQGRPETTTEAVLRAPRPGPRGR